MNAADRIRLRHEFEELLYHEAWLLDNDKLEEWLELFTDMLRYWAPVRGNLEPGREDLSRPHLLAHFDDDKTSLTLRVKRLRTGAAHDGTLIRRLAFFRRGCELADAGTQGVCRGSAHGRHPAP